MMELVINSCLTFLTLLVYKQKPKLQQNNKRQTRLLFVANEFTVTTL